MTNSEWRSTSVPRETNGQDQTTPEHVTVASVSLSALLKAKNSFYKSQNHLWTKLLLVPSHISLVPVPLPLVPGSTTSAQCCTRYHPSGTMVPLPCHPPLFKGPGHFTSYPPPLTHAPANNYKQYNSDNLHSEFILHTKSSKSPCFQLPRKFDLCKLVNQKIFSELYTL